MGFCACALPAMRQRKVATDNKSLFFISKLSVSNILYHQIFMVEYLCYKCRKYTSYNYYAYVSRFIVVITFSGLASFLSHPGRHQGTPSVTNTFIHVTSARMPPIIGLRFSHIIVYSIYFCHQNPIYHEQTGTSQQKNPIHRCRDCPICITCFSIEPDGLLQLLLSGTMGHLHL